MDEFESVIITPKYYGRRYDGHFCSGCGNSFIVDVDYYFHDITFANTDNMKFCPFCGKPIIRFAEPEFIEPIDFSLLEPLEDWFRAKTEELNYLLYCKHTEEQRDEIEALLSFRNCKGIIHKMIGEEIGYKLHYTTIRKLKSKYENDEELNGYVKKS